jgi:oligopeptide/dipeptide ABC transporter ATP-binding protein
MSRKPDPLLALDAVTRRFPLAGGRTLTAVDAVSLSLAPGDAVAVVGESGSGKSTLGRLALGLLAPSAGAVRFQGADLAQLPRTELRRLRARMQIVFQDPWSALDPRQTIGSAIAEPLRLHAPRLSRAERQARVAGLAADVQLPEAALDRMPAGLSGGQLQRVCIARALATDPALLVLDEPTSALDLSTRGGILDLLAGLRRKRGLALLFISHDLDSVQRVCERVVVMYLGAIVEDAPTEALFAGPAHPYSAALLSARLSPDPRERPPILGLKGDPPSPIDLPPGCRFSSRCPRAEARCHEAAPPLTRVSPNREAACWLA